MQLLIIGLGGAFGAIARYWVSLWLTRHQSRAFPIGTFAVNITGSLMLGFLTGAFLKHPYWPSELHNLLAMGFLGAFTTYSTFAFELITMIEQKNHYTAVKYLTASLFFGLLAAYTGMSVVSLM